MAQNAVVTNGAFETLLVEIIGGLFVRNYRHRTVEEPNGQRNVNANKYKKKEVSFFHESVVFSNYNTSLSIEFTRTSPKKQKYNHAIHRPAMNTLEFEALDLKLFVRLWNLRHCSSIVL